MVLFAAINVVTPSLVRARLHSSELRGKILFLLFVMREDILRNEELGAVNLLHRS